MEEVFIKGYAKADLECAVTKESNVPVMKPTSFIRQKNRKGPPRDA